MDNKIISFKAKFIDTPALHKVAEWAYENNKFEQLNKARKQIDYSATKVRIHLDLGANLEGYPIAIFRRYYPKNDTFRKTEYTDDDFIISRPILYQSRRKMDPREFGYEKITQMGYYVVDNKLFKEVVLRPPKYSDINPEV